MKLKKIATSVVASILLVGFAGCGGGGGGSNPSSSVETLSLSGVAVDELILNGVVTVTTPDGKELATGRTDKKNGSYTLDVKGYKGVVVTEVTCDTNSSLLIQPGVPPVQCPTDLQLHAVANAQGKKAEINISPLTEVAYHIAKKLAEEKGGFNPVTVKYANAIIAATFGFNPVDSNPVEDDTYAKVVESFRKLATEQNEAIGDLAVKLADEMNDGKIGDDNLEKEFAKAIKDNNATIPLVYFVENNKTMSVNNPEVLEPIAEVRAFVDEIRTEGNVLKDFGDKESKNISAALEKIAVNIDSAANDIAQMCDAALRANDNNATSYDFDVTYNGHILPTTLKKVGENKWQYQMKLQNGTKTYNGTIAFPSIPDNPNFWHQFTNLTAAFEGELPYKDDEEPTTAQPGVQRVSIEKVQLSRKTVNGRSIAPLQILNAKIQDAKGDFVKLSKLLGSAVYYQTENNETALDVVKVDKVDLDAKAGNYTLNGTLSIPKYTQNKNLQKTGGFITAYKTNLGISFNCPDNENISFDSVSVSLGDNTYKPIETQSGTNWVFFGYEVPGKWKDSDINRLVGEVSCSGNSMPQPNLNYIEINDNEVIGNEGWIPKTVAFDGTVGNNSAQKTSALDGHIDVTIKNAEQLNITDLAKIEDEQFDNVQLKVNFLANLTMPDRPKALLNLKYETLASDLKNYHSISGSYNNEDFLLTLKGSEDKNEKNGQLIFSNGSDIKAVFIFQNGKLIAGNQKAQTGSQITVDGKLTATFETRENDDVIVVHYLDGYIESIF